jgi:hypothetical protein
VNWQLLSRFLAYILVFLTGFLAAKFFHVWGLFKWDNKVNAVSVASLVLTAGISVAFFAVFERQKYSDKLRKDALLDRLRACRTSLLSLDELCEENILDYNKVVPTIKKFRREFRIFMQFAAAAKSPVKEGDQKGFNSIAKTIHQLLTDTPIRIDTSKAPKDAALRKDGNSLILSADRRVEVINQIDREKRCLDGIETGIILKI